MIELPARLLGGAGLLLGSIWDKLRGVERSITEMATSASAPPLNGGRETVELIVARGVEEGRLGPRSAWRLHDSGQGPGPRAGKPRSVRISWAKSGSAAVDGPIGDTVALLHPSSSSGRRIWGRGAS